MKYLRIHIERIEEESLYGHTNTTEGCCISLHSSVGGDHRYIAPLLQPGSQVNIGDYKIIENTYHPRFVILEPDYLVDVSAIAASCESYGNTHLTHLINRLRPMVHTEAILLGHFASQLLDEEVHGMHNRPYRDSVMDFFRRYTLPLLVANVSDSFHNQVRNQRENIHQAFTHRLTQRDGEAILEPSFISEIYGLQGRMDYLQSDYSLLIEQKSGKCGWPLQHPHIPVERASHAMQMMLYSAVVEQLSKDNYPPLTCLLYSKYQQALLPLASSHELLYEALKIRNHIVHAEYNYAHKGYEFLSELTPDDLNTRSTTSPLWTRYQRPQIEQTLSPLHTTDDMERAYYYRMMQFVSREHLYSKVGSNSTGEHGFASKWHDTLEEKLSKGDICHRLRLINPKGGDEGKVEHLLFSFDNDTDLQATNFRQGDIVVLYPYEEGTSPDVRQHIIYRCVLTEIKPQTIQLTLRAPQTDAHVLLRDADKPWAIEHDFIESSYGTSYRALHAFLSMPRERRDLLLLRRKPHIDASYQLRGDYGEFNSLVLRAKQARDMFLLVGPPGTGKTSYGLMSILREELISSPNSSILLLAYTNRAVDEICSKLSEAGLDFIRIGSPHSCPTEYHPHLLESIVASSSSLSEVNRCITQSRIIVGTAMTLNGHNELFSLKHFTLAIVDEASQLLEPHLLGLIGAMHEGQSAIGRFVFIGDHKQLPAVVKQTVQESQVDHPLLREALLTNCRESLFERMFKRYGTDKQISYMLHRQGRMHHDIASFPNEAFYHGLLTEAKHEQCDQLTNHLMGNGLMSQLFAHRVAFIDITNPEATPTDKSNLAEAHLIADIAASAYHIYKDDFSPPSTLGIIVPYRNQIAAVRHAIASHGIASLNDITIDTIERYQGSQREVIIYGFTAHHTTQLEFLAEQTFIEGDVLIDRKLNVAMTRARQHLFMVGDAALLRANTLFAKLLDFVQSKGGFLRKEDNNLS